MDLVPPSSDPGFSERFLAMLCHDLRTPLTAGRMGAELIHRFADQPIRVNALASQVIHQIDRVDKMIRDFLDVARLRTDRRLSIEFVELDLQDLCTQVLEELSIVYAHRFLLRSPSRVLGCWSPAELRRLLENLCGNAVKYGSSEQPVTVSIEEAEPASVRLSVHNWGNPICPERIPSLFEPFQRASQGGDGWGLGLTLVRGVAEAHGGRVEIISCAEKGTYFNVYLPKDSRSAALSLSRAV